MLRRILGRPQTAQLVRTLDSAWPLPDHQEVIRWLRLGADPWARSDRDDNHNKGRPLFAIMLTRCPYYEAVEAWIAVAGDLSKAPWEKRNHPSPILLALGNVSQPDLFCEGVFNRLFDAGCSLRGLEDEGRCILDRVMSTFESPVNERIMTRLVERDPGILRTPLTRKFLAEHPHRSFQQWGIELDAAELDASTPQAPAVRRGPRL